MMAPSPPLPSHIHTHHDQDQRQQQPHDPDPFLEEFLDDFISLDSSPRNGGRGGGGGSTGMHSNTSVRPSSPFSVSLSVSSPPSSPLCHPHWRLTNPVHMEIQENAKLPTFNLPVDRTGSSLTTPTRLRRNSTDYSIMYNDIQKVGLAYSSVHPVEQPSPSRTTATHGASRTDRTDNNRSLAEMFLSDSNRQSFIANYAQAGVLRTDPAIEVHRPSAATRNAEEAPTKPPGGIHRNSTAFTYLQLLQEDDDGDDPLDILAAQVDPTPLSEIRRKHTERHQHSQSYGQYYSSYQGAPGRHFALPIPAGNDDHRQSPTPPSVDAGPAMTDALATAAAIASQTAMAPPKLPNATTVKRPGIAAASSSPPQPKPVATTASGAQQQTKLPPKSQPRSTNRARARSPVATKATTATTSAAMERASQQKAQYGFGPKHVVPSVPAPPGGTKKRGRSSSNHISTLPPSIAVKIKRRGTGDTSSTAEPGGDACTAGPFITAGEAYERKKQKAKNARVQLNESIESLSLAIKLAGTQSKQRRLQWDNLPQSHNRKASVAIIDDCLQITENAKKWDRPAFIGTAASLIQGLNAQCDNLMQELLACHEREQQQQQQQQRRRSSTDDPSSASHIDGMPSSKRAKLDGFSMNGHMSNNNPEESIIADISLAKRIRDENIAGEDHSIFGDNKIASRVASFLDPPTLLRCFRVSKSWKRVFAKQEAWQNMAMERFGHYNVRQWEGKLEDDDEDEGISCLPVTLYKAMDAANVMPHVCHDGMFLLGETRLPGKVSAWAFLVERSNGETLRSVKRKESSAMPAGGTSTSNSHGVYASLPVVELRTLIQNTGSVDEPVVVREQLQTVDASTRRRGVENTEIDWDDRFQKRVLNLDGSEREAVAAPGLDIHGILCRLKLFEAVIIVTYIHAKGCSTTSKFVQRSNFTKVLVQIRNGTTVPLVIPFPRDISHNLEH